MRLYIERRLQIEDVIARRLKLIANTGSSASSAQPTLEPAPAPDYSQRNPATDPKPRSPETKQGKRKTVVAAPYPSPSLSRSRRTRTTSDKPAESTPSDRTGENPRPSRTSRTTNKQEAQSSCSEHGARAVAPVLIGYPPMKEPNPPTHLERSNNSTYRYTQEDKEYTVNFFGWQLKQDRSQTRADICKKMQEKVSVISVRLYFVIIALLKCNSSNVLQLDRFRPRTTRLCPGLPFPANFLTWRR